MNILLGVTGSVSATLTKKLAVTLRELGNVRVVTTDKGRYFFENDIFHDENAQAYIAGHKDIQVFTDFNEWTTPHGTKVWQKKGDPVVHIGLRKWAGVLVIAPITYNTLGMVSNGLADNILTSTVAAWDYTRPIIYAPAMNTMMLQNEITQKNMRTLFGMGWKRVDPQTKMLACNDEGNGAMANISDIVQQTKDCLRWRFPLTNCPGIPCGYHPGAFGFARKHSHHTGVDLYCAQGTFVQAVEDGRVVGKEMFTGPQDNSPWWNDTDCVLVEGPSGIVCYGEIQVYEKWKPGDIVRAGDFIGTVTPVVKEGRERPDVPGHSRAMLHVELYERERTSASHSWKLDAPKWDYLLDPTSYLLNAKDSPGNILTMQTAYIPG